ncbi:MAG: hypothetical protein Q8Q33_07715 [Chlamydiota bacterium]|nr:hypothetical protein [Chlamydiota bacterium]
MFLRYENNKGILLYEALIAVVVLTFGISFAMRAFVYASKSKKITQMYIQSIEILEQKMIEYESAKNIKSGDYEDTVNHQGAVYQWSIRIEPLEQEQITEEEDITDKVVRYWKISGNIWWVQDEKRKVSLETVVYAEGNKEEEMGADNTNINERDEAF